MMQQLAWREPLWLLLAIIPWLWLAWRHKKISAQQERRAAFADLHLWPHLITGRNNPIRSAWQNRSVWILAWTLAALAASGPYIQKQIPANVEQASGIDIAVIIDISPSMSVQDILPNRLERAKLELRDFVEPQRALANRREELRSEELAANFLQPN